MRPGGSGGHDPIVAGRIPAARAGAASVSLRRTVGPLFLAEPEQMFSLDRFHPSALGYRRTAEAPLPAVVVAPLLVATRNRLRFTRLVYTLIAIHACILMVGGKYTYAEVPPFNWLRDHFHLGRNHYDRVGHFAQGFVPAMVARELLLRTTPLRRGKWLFFLVFCVCMAVSAVYELVEWLTAEIGKGGTDAFLGTQGDVWDTQKDMAMALVGAVTALVTMSRWQDRQMGRRKNANIEHSTSNIQH